MPIFPNFDQIFALLLRENNSLFLPPHLVLQCKVLLRGIVFVLFTCCNIVVSCHVDMLEQLAFDFRALCRLLAKVFGAQGNQLHVCYYTFYLGCISAHLSTGKLATFVAENAENGCSNI